MLNNDQFIAQYKSKVPVAIWNLMIETHENLVMEGEIKATDYSFADVGCTIIRNEMKKANG